MIKIRWQKTVKNTGFFTSSYKISDTIKVSDYTNDSYIVKYAEILLNPLIYNWTFYFRGGIFSQKMDIDNFYSSDGLYIDNSILFTEKIFDEPVNVYKNYRCECDNIEYSGDLYFIAAINKLDEVTYEKLIINVNLELSTI